MKEPTRLKYAKFITIDLLKMLYRCFIILYAQKEELKHTHFAVVLLKAFKIQIRFRSSSDKLDMV